MGMQGARRFTDADKARVYATLAANDGNVKRTARETGIGVTTVRRWRDHWKKHGTPAEEAVAQAVGDFLQDAERIRNLALAALEAKILSGDVKASELVTALGVLDDKITRAKGLPTTINETRSALPAREELRELMAGFVEGAIEAAERRHEEIETVVLEPDQVQEEPTLALPPPTD